MKPCRCIHLTGAILPFVAASLILSSAASAQPMFARPGQLPSIGANARAAIVDSVCAAVDSIYVIQEGAEQIVAFWRSQLASGAYQELTDPVEFITRLEEDAQATHRDNHFGIRAMLPLDPAADDQAEDPRETERFKRRVRERNYGFQKVEILPGNVGYLQLNQFAHTEDGGAAETAIAAMNYLANTYALIIDLRQNGGGAASMIRLLATYLFAERVHLINWYERAIDETVQSRTLDYVPGLRLTEAPVYVLTSRRTASAAEEFTFDLKNLERATIVGETTAGAGHTVASEFFDFDGFRVAIRLPYGRAYNPENGEGWEGVGVIPDIPVPSEEALLTAHFEALKTLRDETEDEDTRFGIDWALRNIEGQLSPAQLSKDQLEEYVGTFGPRRVFLDNGALYYRRQDGPAYLLEPMGDDLFTVGDLDFFRLKFGRDAAGTIVKVIGLYDNGSEDANPKSED